jgi:hypothetical protein
MLGIAILASYGIHIGGRMIVLVGARGLIPVSIDRHLVMLHHLR